MKTETAFAERIITHEARRAERIYRPILGHEQFYLTGRVCRILEANREVLAQLEQRKALRVIISSARRVVAEYLLAAHHLEARAALASAKEGC